MRASFFSVRTLEYFPEVFLSIWSCCLFCFNIWLVYAWNHFCLVVLQQKLSQLRMTMAGPQCGTNPPVCTGQLLFCCLASSKGQTENGDQLGAFFSCPVWKCKIGFWTGFTLIFHQYVRLLCFSWNLMWIIIFQGEGVLFCCHHQTSGQYLPLYVMEWCMEFFCLLLEDLLWHGGGCDFISLLK